jgi:hypothetical protein
MRIDLNKPNLATNLLKYNEARATPKTSQANAKPICEGETLCCFKIDGKVTKSMPIAVAKQ